MGGGGAPGGTVDYATWIKTDWHSIWGGGEWIEGIEIDFLFSLYGGSLKKAMLRMLTAYNEGSNPYAGEDAYDPSAPLSYEDDSALGIMQYVHDNFEDFVSQLSKTVDWDTIQTKALAEIDGGMISESDITASITSIVTTALSDTGTLITSAVSSAISTVGSAPINTFISNMESEKMAKFNRQIGRISAMFVDIDSVMSSAFIFANAFAEFEFSNELENGRAKLKLDTYQQSLGYFVESYINKVKLHTEAYIRKHITFIESRIRTILESIRLMSTMMLSQGELYAKVVQTQEAISRTHIVALKEKVDRDIELDTNYATWDLETLLRGWSGFGVLAGAASGPIQQKPSTVQSVLGAGATGIAAGLATGLPGVGIAVGFGALLGSL